VHFRQNLFKVAAGANKAYAVDAPITPPFHIVSSGRRATDRQRYATAHPVKTWPKIIAFGCTFVVGTLVGVGAYHLRALDKSTAEAKTRWLVCVQAHQSALRERADGYRQKYRRWPTNVQELVEAHFLPEFSEVHLCPSQVGGLTRTEYQGSTFVDQNRTGQVAYYASSPYRFRLDGSKFTVICTSDRSHTQ
jgi:hypothetical protein